MVLTYKIQIKDDILFYPSFFSLIYQMRESTIFSFSFLVKKMIFIEIFLKKKLRQIPFKS